MRSLSRNWPHLCCKCCHPNLAGRRSGMRRHGRNRSPHYCRWWRHTDFHLAGLHNVVGHTHTHTDTRPKQNANGRNVNTHINTVLITHGNDRSCPSSCRHTDSKSRSPGRRSGPRSYTGCVCTRSHLKNETRVRRQREAGQPGAGRVFATAPRNSPRSQSRPSQPSGQTH